MHGVKRVPASERNEAKEAVRCMKEYTHDTNFSATAACMRAFLGRIHTNSNNSTSWERDMPRRKFCDLFRCLRACCTRQAKLAHAVKFNVLSGAVLEMKREGKHDQESLKMTMKVLEV